jgi:hypothetical protein
VNAKKRLTAWEALELAKPTADMEVDAALQQIESKARGKRTDTILNSSFWINKYSKDWEDAKKQLESLGYKVGFVSIPSPIVEEEPEEYTYVEWKYAKKE